MYKYFYLPLHCRFKKERLNGNSKGGQLFPSYLSYSQPQR